MIELFDQCVSDPVPLATGIGRIAFRSPHASSATDLGTPFAAAASTNRVSVQPSMLSGVSAACVGNGVPSAHKAAATKPETAALIGTLMWFTTGSPSDDVKALSPNVHRLAGDRELTSELSRTA
ncbi:MAG: hypothetical protein J0I44_02235 [Microbacterium sp.]|uniref:hypothetical protein n=1 Tax=Microbacterium sp. TaxID=51671 RepID=UPI001ACA5DC4|nr:hypothetical protein [Microbacterium sp.]MBN9170149.1 hypothetical protein [Microbacterium sp.]MBN9179845.1 hypothetical protein [Microbacterium sp.]MBN9185318.1 hypothetical protein [Microbacterium sp.]MBN9194203.1 hypothetical protein [Microbacterium sp.]MBN9194885.1 hypothetical protein [Microbacterium sp.]